MPLRAAFLSDISLAEGQRDVRDQLVGLMFRTVAPIVTVGSFFTLWCLLRAWQERDGALALLGVVGGLVMAVRLLIVRGFRRDQPAPRFRVWERRYATATIAFSAVLGSFAVRAFAGTDPTAQIMAAVVVVGYCAGIVTRASVRPPVAVLAVTVAAAPLALAVALSGGPERWLVGAFLAGLIGVSIDTVRHSYRITVDHLLSRRAFAVRAALDRLTGLPNRAMLEERLAALLAGGDPVAVHFIDFDGFKEANDRHGHAAGDAVLQEAARRLGRLAERGGMAGRWGGDEFVLVAPAGSAGDVRRAAERIAAALDGSYRWQGGALDVGVSVGSAVARGAGSDVGEAIAAADRAMIAAKTAGRGRASQPDPHSRAALIPALDAPRPGP